MRGRSSNPALLSRVSANSATALQSLRLPGQTHGKPLSIFFPEPTRQGMAIPGDKLASPPGKRLQQRMREPCGKLAVFPQRPQAHDPSIHSLPDFTGIADHEDVLLGPQRFDSGEARRDFRRLECDELQSDKRRLQQEPILAGPAHGAAGVVEDMKCFHKSFTGAAGDAAPAV